MHLKDLMGDASRWVRAIGDCLRHAVKVEELYTREMPKFFEMQGVLTKKHRSSKGWDKRFFVLSVSGLCYVCVCVCECASSRLQHALSPPCCSLLLPT